jgi:parallel beta-helix repeat protein
MTVIFEDNTVHDAQYGIRVYGSVRAIIRNNIFRPGSHGIYAFENARLRVEYNDIQDAGSIGVFLKDNVVADLGGGKVVIDGDSLASVGYNTLRGNRTKDLVNQTADTVKAEHNVWDHETAAEVLAEDVTGQVDVEPLGALEKISRQ